MKLPERIYHLAEAANWRSIGWPIPTAASAKTPVSCLIAPAPRLFLP